MYISSSALSRHLKKIFLFTGLFNTKQSLSTLLRWLAMSMTKSASKLEFSCWPSPSLSFLVGTRGQGTSPVGVSVSFPSCEPCRSLSLQYFGPLASQSQDGCGTGWQAQSQGEGWRMPMLVRCQEKCLQANCSFTWPRDLRDCMAFVTCRLGTFLSDSSRC